MRRFARIALGGFVLAACSATAREHVTDSSRQPAATLRDLFSVNGVARGDSLADVRRILGPPTRIDQARYEPIMDDSLTTWHYPDLSIDFLRGAVEYLECTGSSCRSGGGVRMGDSVSVVIAKHGAPLPGRTTGGDVVKYAPRDSDCGMTFSLVAKRVSRISLWCDNS
jgi:hypothetical protein